MLPGLAAARRAAGLSQEALACAISTPPASPTTVMRWERLQRAVPIAFVRVLARALKVPQRQLVGGGE